MPVAIESSAAPRGSRPPPAAPLTYEQFLAWADEDTHAEWEQGRIVYMSPISREHSSASLFLLRIVADFVERHHSGEVLPEPFQMKTGPDLPGRAPDILFVAKENLGRLRDTYLDGPADLVVEIISPESRGRDRGDKYCEYEEGGVTEYWLIDPPRQRAEFFQRGADGFYQPVAVDSAGRFHSAVLAGFWLRIEWLWQRPLPALSQVLSEWGAA